MSNNKLKMIEAISHQNIYHSKVDCLKNCSIYNLLVTSHQKKCKDFSYFSKEISTNKKNIFLINNISSTEIINTISESTINSNEKFLFSYNYESVFDNSKKEIEQSIKEEIIQFPIESEKLNLNFLDSPKKLDNSMDKKGLNLLIKFDLNEEKGFIILDKNITCNFLSFKLNAKLHETNSLFNKDIFFLLNAKSIIKSIQIKLEYLQKKDIKQIDNIEYIFVPLLEYPNIGLIISVNSALFPLNIRKMKTNFNSIVKQNFVVKGILIALNISMLFKKNIQLNNSIIKKNDNKEKINNDNINEETTSSCSSNSPKPSNSKPNKSLDYNINNQMNFNLILSSNSKNNINLNIIKNDIYNNNLLMCSYKNKYNEYIKVNNSNKEIKYDNNSNNKNVYYNNYSEYYKYDCRHNYYDINPIIINSNDIFSKTLFNRYQDKTNSTCNLKILIEFLKIQIKKPLCELTLFDFFDSFSKISSLSLKIPFFNIDGNIIKSTITPSLKEIKLLVKGPRFIKRIEKKYDLNKMNPEKNSSTDASLNAENKNNIYKKIEGFEIGLLENRTLLRISYKENKPYYLTDSLSDKLDQLNKIFKSLKKINIDKNLNNKSYISINWNFINTNKTLSSSFISYHLFNGNFLGILSNIKDSEKNFWLNSIEEIDNKRQKINYDYLIIENYRKIYDYINNNQ